MNQIGKLINLILLALCLGMAFAISPIWVSDIDWDIDQNNEISDKDKQIVKEDIIQELSIAPPNCPGCSKILYPIICDNLGNRHNNICEFLCNREKNKALTPKRIILSEPVPTDYCSIKQLK